jgi:hypothetical protein
MGRDERGSHVSCENSMAFTDENGWPDDDGNLFRFHLVAAICVLRSSLLGVYCSVRSCECDLVEGRPDTRGDV